MIPPRLVTDLAKYVITIEIKLRFKPHMQATGSRQYRSYISFNDLPCSRETAPVALYRANTSGKLLASRIKVRASEH